MRLGVITDEVSQNFEDALAFARDYKLDCVELRSAWEKGPFDYEIDDIKKIKALSEEYGIPVTAISSPFFKCEYNEENIKIHNEKFEKLVGFAKILGVKKIRCFDFFKNENVTRKMIIESYKKAYELCEAEQITVLIESEPSTNSPSCKKLAELVKMMNKPYFKALYDPGNNIYSCDEIPYPDGFLAIREHICHMHVKDAVKNKTQGTGAVGVAVGQGEVDYLGVFKELISMGYSGDVMLETHYRPQNNEQISQKTLLNPKGSAISDGGYLASSECVESLKKIIEQAKQKELAGL
jgi:sugar phosphate isomerase/epimerase